MIPKGMNHDDAYAAHARIAAEARQYYAGTKHGANETRAYVKKAWAKFCAGQPCWLDAMKAEMAPEPEVVAEPVYVPPPPREYGSKKKLVAG